MCCAAVGDTERGTLHVVIAAAAEDSMQITDKADTHIEVRVPALGQLCGPVLDLCLVSCACLQPHMELLQAQLLSWLVHAGHQCLQRRDS